MNSSTSTPWVVLITLAALNACDDRASPTDVGDPSLAPRAGSPFVPSPLVSEGVGFDTVRFWPFTGVDVLGAVSDPLNLVFPGAGDVRDLRAALVQLDGDRTGFGFPDAFPFNCTWNDAIGGVQTAYAEPDGWVGSAIQLECGPYGPMRFHLRLFDAGASSLGNVHLEVLIPATTEHQVISWELAEQLVVVDFLRTGLVDLSLSPFPTGVINPTPSFRDIPAVIYNGLPVELRAAIGGPLGDVSDAVPLATDGRATILVVGDAGDGGRMVAVQDFTIEFNQGIPKPFCSSGPFDFVWVNGPVQLRQRVIVTPSGNFLSHFHASGHLDVTPVNPLTGEAVGETYRATVNETHRGMVTDRQTHAAQLILQILLPPAMRGKLRSTIHVGPGGATHSSLAVECGT